MKRVPFSSIFSNADRALLVFTFPKISLTFVEVLQKKKANHQTQSMQTMKQPTAKYSTKERCILGGLSTCFQSILFLPGLCHLALKKLYNKIIYMSTKAHNKPLVNVNRQCSRYAEQGPKRIKICIDVYNGHNKKSIPAVET